MNAPAVACESWNNYLQRSYKRARMARSEIQGIDPYSDYHEGPCPKILNQRDCYAWDRVCSQLAALDKCTDLLRRLTRVQYNCN